MTHIESKKTIVTADKNQIYDFLLDMNNIEKLLPPGKYSDWKSDGTTCSFKVQNTYLIGLKYISGTPGEVVNYESTQGTPFPFTLQVNLKEVENGTEGYMLCSAQINPFLEMLVKGPLKNLFDYMTEQLNNQFTSSK